MSKTPELLIYEAKSFTDMQGRIVQVFEPVSVATAKIFKGRVSVRFHQQMPTVTIEFPFDKETTIEECFAVFDKQAAPYIADVQKKQMEQMSKIVTAKSIPRFPPPRG
jgi:hypothetical protein